jgi:hypothetical protein
MLVGAIDMQQKPLTFQVLLPTSPQEPYQQIIQHAKNRATFSKR